MLMTSSNQFRVWFVSYLCFMWLPGYGLYAAPSVDLPLCSVYPGASPWPPPPRSPLSGSRLSSFPPVPPLVALVAPAPSAPGDTISAFAAIGAIAALVHVRRCDDSEADGRATDGRAADGERNCREKWERNQQTDES